MNYITEENSILQALRKKRILIIGGLGFIGRWIIQTALECNAVVTVMDRSRGRLDLSSVEVIPEDVMSSSRLQSIVDNSDFVIHLAGSLGTDSTFADLHVTALNNVVATAKVIECCLKAKRRTLIPTVANDWLNPYTITRRCAADLAIMANAECDGDFRIMKVMNAYGAWQAYSHTHKLIPVLFRQCFLGEEISIYGDGNQCVDLIHARDVADAFLRTCVVDDIPRDRYIEVGTGIPYRVLEVVGFVQDIVGSKAPVRLVGKRRGEPLHAITLATNDYLSTATGFNPQIKLEEGLRDTMQWYQKHPSYLGIRLEQGCWTAEAK